MTEKARRLESANFERAEAAVRWEDAESTADATAQPADKRKAKARDQELEAADQKIRDIESEP